MRANPRGSKPYVDKKKRRIATAVIAVLLIMAGVARAHDTFTLSRLAAKYRSTVVREVRYHWGMEEKPSMFLAQIHAESGFKADAMSPVGAAGLTQFMPATAAWIQGLYAKDLRELCPVKTGCPLDAGWAIRAMTIYDRHLFNRLAGESHLDKLAFVLTSYNSGLGWTLKEKASARLNGKSANKWWCNVEHQKVKSMAAFRESRWYVKNILLNLRHHYELL